MTFEGSHLDQRWQFQCMEPSCQRRIDIDALGAAEKQAANLYVKAP